MTESSDSMGQGPVGKESGTSTGQRAESKEEGEGGGRGQTLQDFGVYLKGFGFYPKRKGKLVKV